MVEYKVMFGNIDPDVQTQYLIVLRDDSYYFNNAEELHLEGYEKSMEKYQFEKSRTRIKYLPDEHVFFEHKFKGPKLTLLAKDSVKMSWKLISEEKLVLGYSCRKAVVEFRGRKYSAWYTSSVPVSEGPWKFKGLPGLVLEVSDDTNSYRFYAMKVVTNFEGSVPEQLREYFTNDEATALPYRDYIVKENVFFEDAVKRILAEQPVGSNSKIISEPRDNDIESKFEWESK